MKTFEKEYEYLKNLLDKEISTVIKKEEPKLLYEPSKYILASGGKRIRGVLLLLTAKLFGISYKNALPAATAVEILHLFTLVHDDIMDHADTRRGYPTIHKKWDENTAILTGDILIGIAFDCLLKTKSQYLNNVVKTFNNAIIEVCEGQAYDKFFEGKDNIGIEEYYLMIEKKTGKLIESSVLIGAYLGAPSKNELKTIKNYGALIGKAFQIKDDLLDLTGDEKEIGKKKLGDIYENKRTYFYCKALGSFNKTDALLLKRAYNKETKDSKDINTVLELFKKYDLMYKAENEIGELISKAISGLKIFSGNKAYLEKIAGIIGKRKK